MKEGGIFQFQKQMPELDVAVSKIEDVKNIILDKLDRNEETNEIELLSESTLLKSDEDSEIMTNGLALMAVIEKNYEGNETLRSINTQVEGCSHDKWIVTGNNWNFRTLLVPANTTEDIKIRLSHFLKQEHKFAVVDRQREDGRWRGRRFSLNHQNATIHLKDDGAVLVSYEAKEGEVSEPEELLAPEDEKTFDPDEKSSREKKLAIAIAALFLLWYAVKY